MFTAALAGGLFAADVAEAQDNRLDRDRLSVMTYNAEFLWDGQQPEEGRPEFEWKGHPAYATARMQAVASVILDAGPDVVNLVEVENEQVVAFLSRVLAEQGYQPFFVEGRDTFTGQDVALLSKVAPEWIGRVTNDVSKHYAARFIINGRCLTLFGVHFLSRPGDDSRVAKREAQARAIQQAAADELARDCAPIIAGDMNDYDNQTPDHQSSQPISAVLALLRDALPDASGDELVNVAAAIPKKERFTAWWDKNNDGAMTPGELTSIDHILIDSRLGPAVSGARMIHDTPAQLSDHWPVLVELDLGHSAYRGLPEPPVPGVQANTIWLHAALPNPRQDEERNELIEIKNTGRVAVELDGWRVRDKANGWWELSGTISPGEIKPFLRNNRQLSLNNKGDVLELLAPDGQVVHRVEYGEAHPDERLIF